MKDQKIRAIKPEIKENTQGNQLN